MIKVHKKQQKSSVTHTNIRCARRWGGVHDHKMVILEGQYRDRIPQYKCNLYYMYICLYFECKKYHKVSNINVYTRRNYPNPDPRPPIQHT